MTKWESIFINGLGGGLIAGTFVAGNNGWKYTVPLLVLLIAYATYLNIDKKEEEKRIG